MIIVISTGVIILAFIVFTLKVNNGKSDEIEVQTAIVKRERIVQTVTATGRIQPKNQVKISADISAKIVRLEVKEGDWVEKGQFLVELDRERYQAAVESAEANLRSNESNAELVKENKLKAEKDYERAKELFEKKLESQAMLDQNYASYQVERARYQSALDQVEQARASLKQARDDLSKSTIYAPMAGTISQLNKEIGEIALGSQFQEDVILVISNLTGMEAQVDVDENDIVAIAIGDSAKIEVDALPDMVFDGVVSEIANSAKISGMGTSDQKTEFEVKISILNPGTELRPGMTASSDIVTEIREQVLCVPIQTVAVRTPEQLQRKAPAQNSNEAIANDLPEEKFTPDKDGFVEVVFVVEEGVARAKQVKTGIQSDTHIEIVEGLSDDDVVVIGNYRAISKDLQNGSPVIAKEESVLAQK